jgi:tubulin epsilon
MRFEGTLNVDLNEITMNLVPFPDLHFLISSLAPLYSIMDSKLQPRRYLNIFIYQYRLD